MTDENSKKFATGSTIRDTSNSDDNQNFQTDTQEIQTPRRSVSIASRQHTDIHPRPAPEGAPLYRHGSSNTYASGSLKALRRPISPEPEISGNDRPTSGLGHHPTVQNSNPAYFHKPLIFRRSTNEGFGVLSFKDRSSAGVSPLRESFTRENIPSRSSIKSCGSQSLTRKNTTLEVESQNAYQCDNPQRQKSLIRPERRPTQRKYPRHKSKEEDSHRENSTHRGSILRVLKNNGTSPHHVIS
ncbi:hypothetical protein K7432_011498 [Basidiobolus ranarum]|uniref:Uncharacterized protein n=1 Tax=Basidiobolus ranarum TaxID=34480 RepID=A0ABR2VTT2_9FUNG